MRIRLDVAYDGTGFHGWAAQPGLRTVEGELSAALATVLRVPSVALTCAGRTDAGVHARGQVVHADLDELPEGAERLARRLNGVLAARRARAPGGRGAGGVRRAVLGDSGGGTPTGSPTAPRPSTRCVAVTCSRGGGRSTRRR